MSRSVNSELLFIDTFSHTNAEDVNLDLVQFSKVVTVDEVRIVPNGSKVTIPNSSIGTINGATSPLTFTLELYINNKASNDCTFQRIGLIDFKENAEACIKIENNAPTDVLIIKGWYQNVTLAVYGCVSHSDTVHLYNFQDSCLDVPIKNKVKEYSVNEDNSQVLHSSIINSSSSQELVNKYPGSQKNNFLAAQQEALDSNPKSIPLEHVGLTKDPREINAEKTCGDADGGEIEDDERKESFQNLYFDDENDMAEAEPADELTDIYGTLSDGEIPENDLDMTQVVPEDGNLPFNSLMPSESGEIGEDWDDEGSWMLNSLSSFNPCNLQVSPLMTFTDPSLSEYEIEKMKINAATLDEKDEVAERSISQIVDVFTEYKKIKEIERKFDMIDSMATLLTQASLAHLNHRKKNITFAMIDWVVEYLDFDKIISSCDASCAIKNLKVTVGLCGLFCASDEDLATSIISRGVQHSLIDLLSDHHLPPSLRILTLSSLHSSILTSAGLTSFLELSIDSHTPYQRIVRLLSTAKKDRCWQSMARLMNKIHCHELLSLLKQLFKDLVDKTKLLPNLVEEEKEEESMEVDANKENDDNNEVKDNEKVKGEVQSEDKKEVMDVEGGQVAVELQGIVGGLLQALSQLVHLMQSFPGLQDDCTKGVLLKDSSNDNDVLFIQQDCVFLYRNIKECKLLEGLLLLLSSPAINNHPGIFHLCNNILSRFKNCQQGLVFLASMPTITNIVVQLLTQNIECGLDESKPEHVGLSLSCDLRCMQLLDQLKQVRVVDDSGETTPTNLLFHLQSLTFLPQGKHALANIFSKNNNLSALMVFIKNIDEQKIVEFNYVVTLLACIARYSDDVRWMISYGADILKALEEGCKLVRCEEQYKELQEWLAPAKLKLSPESACINSIVDLLKTLSTASYSGISALRLLKHFTIFSFHDEVDEMNCKLLVADLHRCNCLKIFTNILKSMKDKMTLSWQLGIVQAQSDRWASVCTVKLVLTLMRLLVSKLIRARQSQLQDLSCIRPLLTIHSIFCSSLHNGILPPDLQLIQDLCIDILLCFTRTFPESIISPIEIEKSTWSRILGELMDFVVSSPCYFLSGLVLLSELMPLPLPLQTSHNVSKEISTEAVMSRQRWSVHLLTQASGVSQLIGSLSPTSYQPLAQLLRRMCWQIGDLSTPCALLITRSIFDVLRDNLKTTGERAIEADNKAQESSQSTAATLNLASFLFKQPPLKHAFLSLLNSSDENESKYKELLKSLCEMLNVVSDSTSHLLAQVAIAELLNAFCDASISLVSDTSDEDVRLACSLPNATVLQHITTTIFTHLSHSEHKFSSSLVCLRTLACLFTHHYGFYFIKKCSRECFSPFYSLLMRLNASFSKDSLECMSTLSCTIDCLQRLSFVSSSAENEDELLMDVKEMRRLVDWPVEAVHNHPLLDLNALLKEYAKEEPALEPVYLNVNKVYELLMSDQEAIAAEETQEYKLPEALSLKEQMNGRVVFEVVSEDNEEDEDINDKLTSAYWLSTPVGDEDLEGDQVKVNLLSLANECLPTFDLQRELKKHCEQNAEQDKNNLAIKGSTETINTSKLKGTNHGFVAPLRGRGFMRGSGVMSSRDVFRSRPPNTSRPPSMHVDDFVKMETHHQHSATPTLIPLSNMPTKPQELMRSDFDRGAKIVAPSRYLSQLPQRIDDHGMLLRGGYSRMMAADRGVMRGTATGVFRRNYAIPLSINRSETSMSTPSMTASMMDRMTRGVANRGRGGAYHYVHNIPAYFEQKE